MTSIPIELAGSVVGVLFTVIGILWKEQKKWQKLWMYEVRRNVTLAFSPSSRNVPKPEHKEDTAVRNIRDLITQEELDRYLKEQDHGFNPYESTPP